MCDITDLPKQGPLLWIVHGSGCAPLLWIVGVAVHPTLDSGSGYAPLLWKVGVAVPPYSGKWEWLCSSTLDSGSSYAPYSG